MGTALAPPTMTMANFHQRTPARKNMAPPARISIIAVPRSGCFNTRIAGPSTSSAGGMSQSGLPISSGDAVEDVGGGISQPEAQVDQCHSEHEDKRDAEADRLLACPGLPAAVGGGIEHGEADAGDDGEQKHQAPVDVPQLLGKGLLRAAVEQLVHRAPSYPCATVGAAPKGCSGTRRAGSRVCVSSSTSRQIGAATARPPPPVSPPCSTTTAQT